jgi:hypothetical protein
MKSESIKLPLLASTHSYVMRAANFLRRQTAFSISVLLMTTLGHSVQHVSAAEIGTQKPAISQAKLHVVPFFEPGQSVSLTVTDLAGNPLPAAEVNVNDDLITADSMGIVNFTAVDAENIELTLWSSDKRKLDRRKFRRRADGFFAESEVIAEEASALAKATGAQAKFPDVVFAPAVVSPGDEFVIVGSNFSVKANEDRVEIDGVEASVLSATPRTLLVVAPLKLKLGPLRELTVSVGGQTSNVCETDVARTFFSHVKTEDDDVSPEKGKIGMNGTNVPCIISVRNPDLEAASLWSPEPLGGNNVVLTPGGEQNYVSLDVKLARPDLEPQIQLSLRSELDAAEDAEKIPPQLRVAAERAQIMRLERRRIAAEYRLQEIRKRMSEDPGDQERLISESHALSLRMQHLSKMLLARLALFEALGGTDAQYRQAIDDAAGGAMVSLDLSVKPVQVISATEARTVVRTERRGRSLRLLEPPIRLLPPMTEEEQKIALERKAAAAEKSEPDTDDVQDGLRPSLPEEGPHTSQEARTTSTGTLPPEKPKPNTKPKSAAHGAKQQSASKSAAAPKQSKSTKSTKAGSGRSRSGSGRTGRSSNKNVRSSSKATRARATTGRSTRKHGRRAH